MKQKTNLYLLQKYDNGDFYIYAWTAILATKGYKTLAPGEEKPYIELIKAGKNNMRYLKKEQFQVVDEAHATDKSSGVKWDEEEARRKKLANENQWIDDDEEGSADDIISEAVSTDTPQPADLDEVRDINITQESIQAQEMKHIKSLRHKSTIESHMLEKYQLEVPLGKLDVMKSIANSMLTDLAKSNRLYLVDGHITTK